MKTARHALELAFVLACLAVSPFNSAHSQTLYKCSAASGGIEYRNSPCDKSQRSAGAVNKGTVTVAPSTGASTAAASNNPSNSKPASTNGESTLSVLGLNAMLNPIKAMRDDAVPIDGAAASTCKSEGGFYVQGAGCLSEATKNRNSLIGEDKMRSICMQTGQTYIQPLNDCVVVTKP